MICPKCEKKIKNGSKFCPVCGVAIVVIDREASRSIGDVILDIIQWIFAHWISCLVALLILSWILGEAKSMIKDLLK